MRKTPFWERVDRSLRNHARMRPITCFRANVHIRVGNRPLSGWGHDAAGNAYGSNARHDEIRAQKFGADLQARERRPRLRHSVVFTPGTWASNVADGLNKECITPCLHESADLAPGERFPDTFQCF